MIQISLLAGSVNLYRPSDPRGCDPVYLTQCQAPPKRRAEIPNRVSGDRQGALQASKEKSCLPRFNHLNQIKQIATRISSHLSSPLAWELGCLLQDCSDRSQKYSCWLEGKSRKTGSLQMKRYVRTIRESLGLKKPLRSLSPTNGNCNQPSRNMGQHQTKQEPVQNPTKSIFFPSVSHLDKSSCRFLHYPLNLLPMICLLNMMWSQFFNLNVVQQKVKHQTEL